MKTYFALVAFLVSASLAAPTDGASQEVSLFLAERNCNRDDEPCIGDNNCCSKICRWKAGDPKGKCGAH
ncbi:unnamed protein product [Clonostachys solani]|uniref:Uncharacterized protein n=1 Tax=Clonostachys solani TaxID=160281 RepID=A0A9P0EE30_9HYPO|nr:unnamed protein product [Clonostachys solani]